MGGIIRDWSQLPQDLLELIASKADDISDYVRFGAVCESWRCAAPTKQQCPVHLHRQLPWLLIPYSSPDDESQSYSFYDPWNNKSYHHFNHLKINKKFTMIRASYYGWLLIEEDHRSKVRIFLLNPITGDTINLPKLSTRCVYPLITANPYSEDCLVLCSVRFPRLSLLSCKPGDAEWAVLDIELDVTSATMAHCQGKTYIWSRDGMVAVCDRSGAAKVTVIMSLQIDVGSAYPFCLFGTPSGELLLFAQKAIDDDEIKVHVLKADLREPQPKWSEVQSIGDSVLFVSSKHHSCVSTADLPPSLKKNHIYYGDYGLCFYGTQNASANPVLIQNIATKGVEGLSYSESRQLSGNILGRFEKMFWFTPSLY